MHIAENSEERMEGLWWKIAVGLGMAALIVASFVTPAPQQAIGEASRVFYYHVPQAWISVLAFATAAVFSVLYLIRRRESDDERAVVAASLGLVACILATVTGSIFAKITWGSFWNWDPRETSIFILLMIYGAYFALRSAVPEKQRRSALSAVYAILAFITVPFLVFVVPRVTQSLHPDDTIVDANLNRQTSDEVTIMLMASLLLFTLVYFWMYQLGVRVYRYARVKMGDGF